MFFKFKENSFWKSVAFKVILIILGVVIGIGGTFLYIKNFGIPLKDISSAVSKANNEKAVAEIIEKVGKLIVLPKDETPVMATVLDADSLIKKEPFYAGSENGDVIMMYQNALKAIIYSPKRNIIVNVGPVYLPPQDQKSQTNLTEKIDTKSTTKVSATSSVIQKKK